jgi:murein DD-endopeptidase MepM/ murein hydrolase activator NlpD
MTVRNGRGELFVALVLIAPFLSGCATPNTHFDWGTRRVSVGVSARIAPPPAKTAVAVRQPAAEKPHCDCNAVPVPAARPQPGWYTQSKPAPRSAAAAAPQPVAVQPPAATGGRFQWPLQGRVLSEFGSTTGGERNDGLNIAATDGEPIHAAADGVVSYSGNELKSYGNLALIKHGNDYVTAYAHAERFVVAKGDHVSRGQLIGYAGRTGDVTSPQLHFEIRRGAHGETPINPRPLLGSIQTAAR